MILCAGGLIWFIILSRCCVPFVLIKRLPTRVGSFFVAKLFPGLYYCWLAKRVGGGMRFNKICTTNSFYFLLPKGAEGTAQELHWKGRELNNWARRRRRGASGFETFYRSIKHTNLYLQRDTEGTLIIINFMKKRPMIKISLRLFAVKRNGECLSCWRASRHFPFN